MAEMQFKLQIDMFDHEKIKIIQARPKGDTLLILWIRLIALAEKSNAGGLVQLADGIPYTAKMLAAVLGKSLRMINLALTTFEELHMIKNTTEGICIISENQDSKEEWIREQNRVRKQRERERKKEVSVPASKATECANVTNKVTETSHHVTEEIAEISRDIPVTLRDKSRNKDEKERSKEKEEKERKEISSKEDIKKSPRGEPLEYQQIMDDYNRTCTSLTPIFTVSDVRKRKIREFINGMDKDKILPDKSAYERLHILFENAQLSDFLSGRSGCWTGCSFDWLINKANALKVIEGTYNKSSRTKPSEAYPAEKRPTNRFAGFPQRNYSEHDYRKMEEMLLNKECLNLQRTERRQDERKAE